MRKMFKRAAAPQPAPAVAPAAPNAAPPAGEPGKALPEIPVLWKGGEPVNLRTEDDEVRETAHAKAVALLASRDALTSTNLKFKHSKERPLAGDAIAEALGLVALSTTYTPALRERHNGEQAHEWVAAEDAATATTGTAPLNLDAAALYLPVVHAGTFYDALVQSLGFDPVPAPAACEETRADIAQALAAQQVIEQVLGGTVVTEEQVLVEDLPGDASETTGPEDDAAAPAEVVQPEEYVVPVTEIETVEPGTPAEAAEPAEAEDAEPEDNEDEDEPVWENTEAVPMTQAEQDAYDVLINDLRSFSDIPPMPPIEDDAAGQG